MEFDWVSDVITAEPTKGEVLLIRCHTDASSIPGEYDWACAIEVDHEGKYEPKILAGRRSPTRKEIKELAVYFAAKGYTGSWNRFKVGKPTKTVVIK